MATYKEIKELIDTHMIYVREDLGEIKGHLSRLNGHLDDHSYRITNLEAFFKLIFNKNLEAFFKFVFNKKVAVGGISGVAAIISLVILWVGQAIGWWTIVG